MARKKKIVVTSTQNEIPENVEIRNSSSIVPLSIDYPSEGLNNIARKINEIIEEING